MQLRCRICSQQVTGVSKVPHWKPATVRLPPRSLPCRSRAVQKDSEATAASTSRVRLDALVSLSTAAIYWHGLPAWASDMAQNPFQDVQGNSLYVTLALFLMSVPGIWSQVKRAPKSAVKRKVFEVDGPATPGAMPLDERARQIFRYFKSYNYDIKSTGEVIVFEGIYKAETGQAAALAFYTFCGMASIALVLSTILPDIGNWWYGLTVLTPLAPYYYLQKGTRQEEFKVKMVTSDDESKTDIVVEGDKEEIERFWKELGLVEKGMVYVKGVLD